MSSSLHGKNYYKTVVRNLKLIVKCGICGHKQKLQFHHVKPTSLNGEGRGSTRRAFDIVKHPDCYIPLCYFCHQKVTLKELFIVEHSNMWGWKSLWWSKNPLDIRLDWLGNNTLQGVIHVIN